MDTKDKKIAPIGFDQTVEENNEERMGRLYNHIRIINS